MNNKHILVVEDDIPILQAISIKLKSEGFDVEQATDGKIGLEKLKEKISFSAILLDLRMPKGDGFEFLEKKGQNPDLKHIPVIVFTNLSQLEFVNRAVNLGAKGYLIKAHHSLEDIVKELKTCIKEGRCKIDR